MKPTDDGKLQEAQFYKGWRESYRYVPAHLLVTEGGVDGNNILTWEGTSLSACCPDQATWDRLRNALNADRDNDGPKNPYSSFSLDEFHNNLLWSEKPEAPFHGLLSVMFWGFTSGTDHQVRKGRALGKARMLYEGRRSNNPENVVPPDTIDDVIAAFRATQGHVRQGNFGAALASANRMKFWGYSFASKLVMFMDPEKAVVYDSVIWELLSVDPDPTLRKMATTRIDRYSYSNRAREAICEQYQQWCNWCAQKASGFNQLGVKWKDWDGDEHEWRAVDVERAFFAKGRPPQ